MKNLSICPSYGEMLKGNCDHLAPDFETEITELIKWFDNRYGAAPTENIDKHSRMIICDDMLAKIIRILRKTYRVVFNLRWGGIQAPRPHDLEILTNEDDILRAVRSKSNSSTAGSDGFCNGVWKIGNKTTASIIKIVIKCRVNTCLFPNTLE